MIALNFSVRSQDAIFLNFNKYSKNFKFSEQLLDKYVSP